MGDEAADKSMIPMFERGAWRSVPRPAEEGSGDLHEMMGRAGFGIATRLGPKDFASIPVPLELVVWSKNPTITVGPDEPRYLVDVKFPDASDTVAARDVVDLMDVLTRWTPALDLSASTYESFRRSEEGWRSLREAKEAEKQAKAARRAD